MWCQGTAAWETQDGTIQRCLFAALTKTLEDNGHFYSLSYFVGATTADSLLDLVARDLPPWRNAPSAYYVNRPTDKITVWNDAPERTHAHIMTHLDNLIRECQENESASSGPKQ